LKIDKFLFDDDEINCKFYAANEDGVEKYNDIICEKLICDMEIENRWYLEIAQYLMVK